MDRSGLRRYYDRNAAVYDRWMASYDRVMLGSLRHRLCGLARGRTLEVAVGTGLNLVGYPPGTELIGVDYSPEMLRVARRRVRQVDRVMHLAQADAYALPFADASFDSVVTTLFLSSAPDPAGAVAEVSRVLRPEGSLLVVDHGRSDIAPVHLVERMVRGVLRARTGVDLSREPTEYLDRSRFRVERVERSRLGIVELVVARRLR